MSGVDGEGKLNVEMSRSARSCKPHVPCMPCACDSFSRSLKFNRLASSSFASSLQRRVESHDCKERGWVFATGKPKKGAYPGNRTLVDALEGHHSTTKLDTLCGKPGNFRVLNLKLAVLARARLRLGSLPQALHARGPEPQSSSARPLGIPSSKLQAEVPGERAQPGAWPRSWALSIQAGTLRRERVCGLPTFRVAWGHSGYECAV